jgi:hypothetical protein
LNTSNITPYNLERGKLPVDLFTYSPKHQDDVMWWD